MKKVLMGSCCHMSNLPLYQISGHLVYIQGHRSQKYTFLVKNVRKPQNNLFLKWSMKKMSMGSCEHMFNTPLYQISGHLVSIQGHRSKQYIFLVKNDRKTQNNSFLKWSMKKVLMGPYAHMSNAPMYRISGH